MKRLFLGAALAAAILVMASCSQDHQQQTSQVNYNEVKTMVVDILKTEDGQKSIQEAMLKGEQSETMQILNTGQGQQLQMAVKEVMGDPAYSAALKEAMIDPRFAGDFAKAITKENMELHKKLIKDPEYQQALIDIFKDPQMQAMIMQTMKSNEYRQQVMTIMKESIQSPLFQQDILKLMEKALEEQAKPKSDAEKGAKASQAGGEKDAQKSGDGEGEKKKEEEKKQ